MGTYARVSVSDDLGGSATVLVGSDGHHLGKILIDCAVAWKRLVNDGDPPPPPGTAPEFADTLCTGYWGRQHNGDVVPAAGDQEYEYAVALTAGRVAEIVTMQRVHDHRRFMSALRTAGPDTALATGRYVELWRATFPPEDGEG